MVVDLLASAVPFSACIHAVVVFKLCYLQCRVAFISARAVRLLACLAGAMVCWLAIEGCQRYLKNLNAETDNRNTLTS